jgi:hypothetical protein
MFSAKIRADGSVFLGYYHAAYRIDWHLVTSKRDLRMSRIPNATRVKTLMRVSISKQFTLSKLHVLV